MNIPPMAWVILALGVLWLLLRWWQGKRAAERAEARESRLAELYAEREKLAAEDGAPARTELKDQRCLGCRTVNPGDARTCSGCGLEL